MTKELSNRFRQLREELKLKQAKIAAMTGLHVQTWSKYERGEQVPSAETLSTIADKLLVNLGWLLTGVGDIFKTPKDILKRDVRPVIERIKNALGLTTDEEVEQVLRVRPNFISSYTQMANEIPYPVIHDLSERTGLSLDWLLAGKGQMRCNEMPVVGAEDLAKYGETEFVLIPRVSGEISAGGGMIADNTIEIRVAFRRDWIERKGDPKNMSLIRVSGDSMEPSLLSGDLVLIDHNRNFIDPQGGIYAIAAGNIIMIKRLQVNFLTNRIKVISDNPRYDPAEIEQDKIRINGKVIWYGREIER